MLSEKDIEALVKKYGELWVLRDLDFFPEKLSEMSRFYPYDLNTWIEATKEDSGFITFKNEMDAVTASIRIYYRLGRSIPMDLYKRYWELTHPE